MSSASYCVPGVGSPLQVAVGAVDVELVDAVVRRAGVEHVDHVVARVPWLPVV